jgi:hypothetical protein
VKPAGGMAGRDQVERKPGRNVATVSPAGVDTRQRLAMYEAGVVAAGRYMRTDWTCRQQEPLCSFESKGW